MEVRLSSSKSKRGEALIYLLLGLIFATLIVLPGLVFPSYLRWLSTVFFLALALIVARAYLAAITTFRHARDPPPKPEGAEWPTVSVLVPAYNEASVLPRTLSSMLKLDYPADKVEFVYVYEKRSTDGTPETIRAFAAKHPNFRAIERNDQRGGKAAATNFGLAHCRNDIIVSLDADHALKPNAIKRAVQWFLADPNLMCVKGRAIGINGSESFLALQTKLERDAIEKGDVYMRRLIGGFTFFGGGQAFFRREVFERLGLFDEEILIEDIDFSVKIHEAGFHLLVDPKIESYEENPAFFSAWWAQRKRWARGWMQVALRYLPHVHGMQRMSWRQKLDLYHTLLYVLVPVVFLALIPLSILARFGYDTRDYLGPWTSYAWTAFMFAPAVGWLCMWAQDRRDGVRHDAREWLGLPFLWAYMIFQTTTFWSAFVDEFILRRPSIYVKTSKTGGETPLMFGKTPEAATLFEGPAPRQ